jgi:serine/threonine protein kinase
MDTKEVIARFEQERQALAMMDHPNIAKVSMRARRSGAGLISSWNWCAGIKITDYCDQANLPTAERLALFIQVCNAVQHAHQKGIIHRDLKPSNILVTLHDGVPVPKVIDFGVAKATQTQRLGDLTIYTQFQQMIGTPLYMSPEQAEMSGLDIDTRSDIYSLGVLLYELLVGRTPFDPETLMRAGSDEIRRVIREEEPPKPSTALQTMAADARASVAQHRQTDGAKMARLLSGELDWIVMKALEKDRTRRYETANGFAEDIRRYLANEPVTAAAPSVAYLFRKFARRHKAPLGLAALIAVVLVAATGSACGRRNSPSRRGRKPPTRLAKSKKSEPKSKQRKRKWIARTPRIARCSSRRRDPIDSLRRKSCEPGSSAKHLPISHAPANTTRVPPLPKWLLRRSMFGNIPCRRRSWRGMRIACRARSLVRTVPASPLRHGTRPRGCGTSRPASPSPRSRGIRIACGARSLTGTAHVLSLPHRTRLRGCGTSRPANPSPRSRAMKASCIARGLA